MHRTVSQIKAKAPNSSAAYISTETRIPAFERLFASPMAMQDLALKHHSLDSHAAVAEEVAKLIGGPLCKPSSRISHAQLVDLLYHSTFKFSRGATTLEALPRSDADKLRREKPLALVY